MPATKVNKSEEIRKLYKSGVKRAPEILAKLKERGIKVAPAMVYQVIHKMKVSRVVATAKKSASGVHRGAQNGVIENAVVFVKSAGGMANARALLAKLAEMPG